VDSSAYSATNKELLVGVAQQPPLCLPRLSEGQEANLATATGWWLLRYSLRLVASQPDTLYRLKKSPAK